ncbi:MAG: proton-conducting transporter membrane subunit [Paracoccaceae bacterium]
MSWTLAAPLLIPFVTAVAALLAPRFGIAPRAVGLVGAGLHAAAAVHLAAVVIGQGVIAATMGGWPVPVGIVLVADTLSALMVATVALMGLATAAYALADIDARRERAGWHALVHVLLAGATGAFLTGDLFNLYVWFEVMLIASFGLMVLGGTRVELDAGVKYAALNVVATILFLLAIGLIHALAGTLTLADLPGRLADADPAATGAAAFLLFGAFAMKAGLFPVFFWLPASYHAPPVATTALFAAVLTKAGVYAMMRVFTLVFPEAPALDLLGPLAVLTMVLGVIGAAAQGEVHRILSFHIVSQVGYMALGLAIATPLALAAAILYMIHNIVVKACLFLIAGLGRRLSGSHDLDRAGGLYAASPLLSALFVLAALAMAGIPPFSGFWGKLMLVEAGLASGDWIVPLAVLGVGLFTLYSMTKIWLKGFLKPRPAGRTRARAALPAEARRAMLAPVGALVAVSLVMGLWPEPFVALSTRAAGELLDPAPYIAAVMGDAQTAEARTGGTR